MAEMAAGPLEIGARAVKDTLVAAPQLPPLLQALAKNPSLASTLASALSRLAGADAERRPLMPRLA